MVMNNNPENINRANYLIIHCNEADQQYFYFLKLYEVKPWFKDNYKIWSDEKRDNIENYYVPFREFLYKKRELLMPGEFTMTKLGALDSNSYEDFFEDLKKHIYEK